MPSVSPITPPIHPPIPLGEKRRVVLAEELGRGSTATVYRGVLEGEIRRPVAVKVYDLSASEEPEGAIVSIARAAQRAACVEHPNVVHVLDVGAAADGLEVAIIQELVEGTTLARLIESHTRAGRKLPLDLALFVATEVADALSGARHAVTAEGLLAGIAHLDLAPHQVLLSKHGEVKLSDFGLANATRWGSAVRSIRAVALRAAAMAPEIARGRAGDTRSDVFSLGIMMREMLMGPRFAADVSETDALEFARDGYVPPTFLELQLPPDVRMILRQALEVDPARRYPHATAMAYELRRVALSMGVGDGRVFLRTAVAAMPAGAPASAPPASPRGADLAWGRTAFPDEEATDELDLNAIGAETPPPVPPDRASGLIRKADRESVPSVERETNGTDE